MFYLRFTNTANEDLDRSTSINAGPAIEDMSKEDAASIFGCDDSDVEEIDGCWCQILNGLCGYELESESLEEAIEEVKESDKQFSFVGRPVIFKGAYSNDSDFVADGDLFIPEEIIIEL